MFGMWEPITRSVWAWCSNLRTRVDYGHPGTNDITVISFRYLD